MQSVSTRLTHLQQVADGLLRREADGERIERRAIDALCNELRATLRRLRGATSARLSWTADAAALASDATRADENLGLAETVLSRALGDSEPSSEHARLHDAAEALFHAQRCVTLLERLDKETADVTRDIDRARNEREFLSG